MADHSGSPRSFGGGKAWPIFRSLADYRLPYLRGDLFAGLTLAAIAIPEQMATARLGGFAPQIGFFAFVAGSLAFAVFGGNRFLSSGADSTITPIFAGGLAALAATGSPDYATLAAALALMVGLMLAAVGHFPSGLDRRSLVDSRHDRLSRRHLGAYPDFAVAGDPRAAGARRSDAPASGDADRTSRRRQRLYARHRPWRPGDHRAVRTDRCADSRRVDRPCIGSRCGRAAAARKPGGQRARHDFGDGADAGDTGRIGQPPDQPAVAQPHHFGGRDGADRGDDAGRFRPTPTSRRMSTATLSGLASAASLPD